jgi:uncharacterized OB-fold protein
MGSNHDEFWEFCNRGELRLQKCLACAEISWPPVRACESCNSSRFAWAVLSGRGRIVSWCRFEQKYYDDLPVPWDTILVELDEGPLFITNPKGFTNDEVRSGDRVKVAFICCEDDAGEFRLPVFERA